MSPFESSEPENITSQGKRDFADVIKLRVLRWEIILDYLCGSNIITSVLIRGKWEGQSQRRWDDRRRGWRDVTRSRGTQVTSRIWKRQGIDSPLDPPERISSD